ncbi:MAG TPA: recombinase A [Polyangiaceae bacterium]|nr:recombinase A [Polyangiaceae bacterium]
MVSSSWASSVALGGPLVEPKREALVMAPPLSSVLPGGGFPQGAVIELASPGNLGHGVSVALAASAASQEESVRRGGVPSWCAFLDSDRTLFAPAVQASGICLGRMLVVRPPRQSLAKVAVRVASSRIFSVIVIDVASVPGADRSRASSSEGSHRFESMEAWVKVVRRLSLAVEKTHSTVFLLTKSEAVRERALPVAMRVELEGKAPGRLCVRVAKEKFGRVTSPRQIAWTRPSRSHDEDGDPVALAAVSSEGGGEFW